MKRQLVLLSSILVLSSAVIAPGSAFAENFEAQIEQNSQLIEQNNAIIEGLKQEQIEKAQQLARLVKDIERTQVEVTQLAQEITNTQNQLVVLEKEIQNLNEVIAKRAAKIVEQARYLQTENTNGDLLSAVFSSSSIVEAFEKVWAMTELTSASNEVLKQQKHDKEQVEIKKTEMDTKLQEQGARALQMQTLVSQQAQRRGELETILTSIENETLATQSQNAELHAQIETARAAKAQYEAELAARREAEQQSALAAQRAQEEAERANFIRQQESGTATATTNTTTQAESTSRSTATSSSATVSSVGYIAGGGNFPAPNPSYVAPLNGGYPGQCTWYVYNRLAQLGSPIKYSMMGNGGEWGAYARSYGYSVTNTPKAGTAVSWQGGEAGINTHYGHVAFVEAVNPDGSILISEMNYKGEFILSTRLVSAADARLGDYIDFGL